MMFTRKNWLALLSLTPATAIAFLDQTILPVALPTIEKELGASYTQLQWCVNAYLLAIATFVLIGGKISDRLGHRKVLCIGIAGFAFCSALCGISPNIETLIIARGLQGLSAAFMFPANTAVLRHVFPPEQRGRATGLIVSTGSLFMIIAPLIGGYLTEAASWRWIFWINLPISIIGIWMILKFLPKVESLKVKIDFTGFVFFAIATSALILFFMQAADWGWTTFKTWICAGIVPVAYFFLLRREKMIPSPFLDLPLFKMPIFAATNISVTMTQFILMITVFQTIYFQQILGYSPIQTGLISFTSCAPIFFMAPIAGFLSDRFSSRLPIALGYLFLIFSFFLLAFFNTPSLPLLITALVAFGMGIPFILTPSFSSAISSVPADKAGVALGLILTLRMIGGTVGLALISLFVHLVQKNRMPIVGERDAVITSFSGIHFMLAFLMIGAFAITFILYNRKSTHHIPDSPAEGWD